MTIVYKKPSTLTRNETVYHDWLHGADKRDLAWRFGVEPTTIQRIIDTMKREEITNAQRQCTK